MNSVYSALSREKNEVFLKDLGIFFNVCHKVLNKHTPRKKKYVGGKTKPFMIKELSNVLKQKSTLCKNYIKTLYSS